MTIKIAVLGYCITILLSSHIFCIYIHVSPIIKHNIPSFGFQISCGLSLVLPDLWSVQFWQDQGARASIREELYHYQLTKKKTWTWRTWRFISMIAWKRQRAHLKIHLHTMKDYNTRPVFGSHWTRKTNNGNNETPLNDRDCH